MESDLSISLHVNTTAKNAFISYWRHHPESNRGIKVLQTSALPLGYGAIKNGAGDGARTRHLCLGKAALYRMSYSRKTSFSLKQR